MSSEPAEPYVAPREPVPEEEASNMLLGFGLFGLFLLLAAGTIAVGFVYLALD